MTEYKKTRIRKGMRVQTAYSPVLDTTPKTDKKTVARAKINEEVFDLQDAVADNAKMISLLMSTVKRIYEALPDDTKDNIQDKEMIESMIQVFDTTQTLADVQFEVEGDAMVQKIFERQGQIGSIVKQVYGI